ncbi:MAG: ferredoxin--NADP reductase [Pseudomonadota bacterium]
MSPLPKASTNPVTDTVTASETTAKPTLPDAQTVTEVKHYTDRLFSFRTTRPASLRFRSGEFVMIGLMGDVNPKTGKQKPLLRAYSIASPSWDEELEFYSIKVPDGPLTSKLQHIKPGDEVILRPKPVGTLVHDALLPGKRLWLFSTGTGFAPFSSLLRDPETFERFEQVIVTHTCRGAQELTYSRKLVDYIRNDEMMGELLGEENIKKLVYYPTTTQEESPVMGRITTLLESGQLLQELGIDKLSPETDRAMICGSMGLNLDLKKILEDNGLEEGANSDPKHFVVEKAFVG